MELNAKVRSEYLDRILKKEKDIEWRQIEGITLTDENGRSARYEVEYIISVCPSCYGDIMEMLKEKYPKVKWSHKGLVVRIELGEQVYLREDKETDILQIIRETAEANEDNMAAYPVIISAAINKGYNKFDAEQVITDLKAKGKIYEPRHSMYMLTEGG